MVCKRECELALPLPAFHLRLGWVRSHGRLALHSGDAGCRQQISPGRFRTRIDLYEAALDDSPRGAEAHYKLALLYDDKLNDPVSALHHFKRYLALSPNGPHAKEVKDSIKRDEIAALPGVSGDSVIPRAEAAQLRNENLTLRKQLEARASSRIGSEKSQRTDAKKAGRRRGTEAMLCSRATRSCRFRERFISLRNVGKPFASERKGYPRSKNLRSARRSLFRNNLVAGIGHPGPNQLFSATGITDAG